MTTATLAPSPRSFTPKPSMDQVSIEWINADLADLYLSTNFYNRTPKQAKIAAYVRDMSAGNWVFNGETIKFDADGLLIDGQNRLMAVSQAGVELPFLVVRGLVRVSQDTVDTGAARTFGDVLKMRGYSAYNEKAAVTNLLRRFQSGGRKGLGSNTRASSTSELLRVFLANPWIEQESKEWSAIARNTMLSPAIAGLAWGILSRIDRVDAEHFFARLGADTGHREGCPILALRRTLMNSEKPINGTSVRIWLALIFKAWNKFRSGDSAAILSFKAGGATPESFPTPV